MAKNPLIELEILGQSIWLDYISRALLDSGEFHRLIKDDHLKGVTSNPSIFEKAIAKTDDYKQAIDILSRKDARNAKVLYENLAVKDIEDACDLLRPTYEENKGSDGFASLEVSPHLAFDTAGTIEEGKHLWHQVDRPNLMIKVPGTKEGMGAIRALIGEGINVNVTLLFSVNAYKDAALAYLQGLKDRAEKGLPISSVQSVASFFVSRIDSKVDPKLEKVMQESKDQNKIRWAQELLGTIAIANAKVAYLCYEEIYQGDLAKSLIRKGAHPQRLLWASTSTKNNRYPDVLYVESLIGKNTVNTLPPDTLKAFRDHGKASNSLMTNIQEARATLDRLSELGIDFESCCRELLQEGVKLFADAFDQLLGSVDKKLTQIKNQSAEKKK